MARQLSVKRWPMLTQANLREVARLAIAQLERDGRRFKPRAADEASEIAYHAVLRKHPFFRLSYPTEGPGERAFLELSVQIACREVTGQHADDGML
ncbi:hypothetical protein LOC51_00630 [Rubrivivax sp. JA1024]|nr:hypothetical protein [Rubrivivax sp. JA1024]